VRYLLLLLTAFAANTLSAQPITTAGEPAQLEIRQAGEHSIRIVLKPQSYKDELPFSPALVERTYPAPAIVLKALTAPVKKQVGPLMVEVTPSPLTVTVTTAGGVPVQKLIFNTDNTLSFALHDAPVLGMGEGGHKAVPGIPWRTAPIEFDRRGRLQDMQPRWQGDSYGSRNPVALIIPCHRVLAAGGKVGGFSAPGGAATKVRMLALEGVDLAPPPPAQRSLAL